MCVAVTVCSWELPRAMVVEFWHGAAVFGGPGPRPLQSQQGGEQDGRSTFTLVEMQNETERIWGWRSLFTDPHFFLWFLLTPHDHPHQVPRSFFEENLHERICRYPHSGCNNSLLTYQNTPKLSLISWAARFGVPGHVGTMSVGLSLRVSRRDSDWLVSCHVLV